MKLAELTRVANLAAPLVASVIEAKAAMLADMAVYRRPDVSEALAHTVVTGALQHFGKSVVKAVVRRGVLSSNRSSPRASDVAKIHAKVEDAAAQLRKQLALVGQLDDAGNAALTQMVEEIDLAARLAVGATSIASLSKTEKASPEERAITRELVAEMGPVVEQLLTFVKQLSAAQSGGLLANDSGLPSKRADALEKQLLAEHAIEAMSPAQVTSRLQAALGETGARRLELQWPPVAISPTTQTHLATLEGNRGATKTVRVVVARPNVERDFGAAARLLRLVGDLGTDLGRHDLEALTDLKRPRTAVETDEKQSNRRGHLAPADVKDVLHYLAFAAPSIARLLEEQAHTAIRATPDHALKNFSDDVAADRRVQVAKILPDLSGNGVVVSEQLSGGVSLDSHLSGHEVKTPLDAGTMRSLTRLRDRLTGIIASQALLDGRLPSALGPQDIRLSGDGRVTFDQPRTLLQPTRVLRSGMIILLGTAFKRPTWLASGVLRLTEGWATLSRKERRRLRNELADVLQASLAAKESPEKNHVATVQAALRWLGQQHRVLLPQIPQLLQSLISYAPTLARFKALGVGLNRRSAWRIGGMVLRNAVVHWWPRVIKQTMHKLIERWRPRDTPAPAQGSPNSVMAAQPAASELQGPRSDCAFGHP